MGVNHKIRRGAIRVRMVVLAMVSVGTIGLACGTVESAFDLGVLDKGGDKIGLIRPVATKVFIKVLLELISGVVTDIWMVRLTRRRTVWIAMATQQLRARLLCWTAVAGHL